MQLGAHVERSSVLADAEASGSNAVQIFLSPPRSWAAPKSRGDETDLLNSGLAIYVHSPYLLNPASRDPEVRRKTRQALQDQAAAAAEIGAKGLVVHGGHPTGTGSVQDGIDNWVEVLDGIVLPVKLLIENTAGGNAAVARTFEAFARLFETLHRKGHDIGVCLDTCHAHAGGEALEGVCERMRMFAGSIDLVHANDSRDTFNSGRDRHANLGEGECGADAIVATVRAAKAPTVVETPGGIAKMSEDIEILRRGLR